MARRYYRRYRRYKRTYYRKKRWTAYNTEIRVDVPVEAGRNLDASSYIEVVSNCVNGASNSLQSNATPTNSLSSVNYYVCRCRYKGIFESVSNPGLSYIVYVAFVPNAVTVSKAIGQNTNLFETYFYRHPEYILAWNRLDYINNTGDTGDISLYSRVSKKIAPGDKIVVGVLARNVTNAAIATSAVQGTFSCYLRTN